MSDIETELGAELIKRMRAGTLNGTGGRLVQQARDAADERDRMEALRKDVERLRMLVRCPNCGNPLRELHRLANTHKIERWLDGHGDGI